MDKKLNYDTPKLEIIDIETDDILLVSGISKNDNAFDWEADIDETW